VGREVPFEIQERRCMGTFKDTGHAEIQKNKLQYLEVIGRFEEWKI